MVSKPSDRQQVKEMVKREVEAIRKRLQPKPPEESKPPEKK